MVLVVRDWVGVMDWVGVRLVRVETMVVVFLCLAPLISVPAVFMADSFVAESAIMVFLLASFCAFVLDRVFAGIGRRLDDSCGLLT